MRRFQIIFIRQYGKGYNYMEWSKVKTILIALLVFVNTLLISNIFLNTSETINIKDDFIKILSDRNIILNEKIDAGTLLDLYDAEISKYGVNTIMKNMLGDLELTDLGEGAISYESANGSGIETGSGNFNIKLNNISYPKTIMDAKDRADKLLKDMNYAYILSLDTQQGYVLEYTKTINKIPVYGFDIKMIFGKDNTITIAGKFFLEATIRQDTIKKISIVDVILKMQAENITIEEIGTAYMIDDARGEPFLIPCIYIITDTETLYFDKNLVQVRQDTKKVL